MELQTLKITLNSHEDLPIFSRMSKKISIGLLFLLISAQLYIKPEAVNAQVQIPTSKSNNSQKICSTQLPSKINRIINSPQYRRSNWGI